MKLIIDIPAEEYDDIVLQDVYRLKELGEHIRNGVVMEDATCEDCVSREDVKSEMIKYGFLAPDMTVTEFVEYLSPVNPQRPKGKWIDEDTEQGVLGFQYKRKRCSKCGWSHSLLIPKDYCPNCGAKMEG